MTDVTNEASPGPGADDHAHDTQPASTRRSRVPRIPRVLVIGVALLVAGGAFGIGESAAITARHNLSQTRGQLSAARSKLTRARNQLNAARSQLTTAQAQVQAAQAAATQANAKAQAKYAAAEARLAAATRKLNTLIGRIQASAISADGVYVVGQDIKPGTWHTAGDGGQGGYACYYATLASTNTSDITDNNNNFDGPETVNVTGAYAFQISGPCTWHRTGP